MQDQTQAQAQEQATKPAISDCRLEVVSLDLIDFGTRFREDYGNLDELITSFRKEGMIQPIAIYQKPTICDGEKPYLLLAGGRRFKAATQGKFETMPCRIFTRELDESEIRSIELAENYYRKDLTWQERTNLAKEIHELQVKLNGAPQQGVSADKQTGHRMEDTANMLGVSKGKISQDIALAKAMEVIPELKNCKTADDARKMLNKMYDKAVTADIAKKIEAERASTPLEIAHKSLINSYIIGDFLVGVKAIPDKSMNIVEIDPPYAIDLKAAKKSDNNTNLNTADYNEIDENDYVSFMSNVLDEAYRVMADDSWLILWFAPEPWFEVMYQLLDLKKFKAHRMCGIWTKPTGQSKRPDMHLANGYEMFFYARKGNPRIVGKPGRLNIFNFKPVDPTAKIHPTERPIELTMEILSTFGRPGDRVLVPFLGSGNTILSSSNLGMSAIGFDLSQPYKNDFMLRVTASEPGKYTSYKG
jgi:DNA modification methylase